MGGDEERWGGELWAAADLATPMAIRVAATLRLADHIAGGRRTAEALAVVVDADADALGRVMGHLVSAGVLSQERDGAYGLTELGEQLRDDAPGGVRATLDLEGAIGHADLCFVELLHTVRTGEPAFPRHFGRTFWEDLSADSKRGASFDALMGGRLAEEAPAVAAAYPWGDLGRVVDVGGGDGSLLIAILRAYEGLRGTVVDLAGPIARAEAAIAETGMAHRADARWVASSTLFLPGRADMCSRASFTTGMTLMPLASCRGARMRLRRREGARRRSHQRRSGPGGHRR